MHEISTRIWKGETKQEIGNMTARYQAEIERLREGRILYTALRAA